MSSQESEHLGLIMNHSLKLPPSGVLSERDVLDSTWDMYLVFKLFVYLLCLFFNVKFVKTDALGSRFLPVVMALKYHPPKVEAGDGVCLCVHDLL